MKIESVVVEFGKPLHAGGVLEISRWRKPPDRCPESAHPGGVLDAGIPASLPGRALLFTRVRWLAPPANFRQLSGLDGVDGLLVMVARGGLWAAEAELVAVA